MEDVTKRANEGHLTREFFQSLPARKASPDNPGSPASYLWPGGQEGRLNQWLGLGPGGG